MEIHGQLVLAPDALAGTRAPALWACVGILAVVALACGVQAGRSAPRWTELPSVEVMPLGVATLHTQRTGTYATEPVAQGEALVLPYSESAPPALAAAWVPLEDGHWALRIHDDLQLGAMRQRSLNRGGLAWTVTLLDKQVVRIASVDGELLGYREFEDAWQHRRWHLALWAGASALAAALLAVFSRRILSALARRDARSRASSGLKSP